MLTAVHCILYLLTLLCYISREKQTKFKVLDVRGLQGRLKLAHFNATAWQAIQNDDWHQLSLFSSFCQEEQEIKTEA